MVFSLRTEISKLKRSFPAKNLNCTILRMRRRMLIRAEEFFANLFVEIKTKERGNFDFVRIGEG